MVKAAFWSLFSLLFIRVGAEWADFRPFPEHSRSVAGEQWGYVRVRPGASLFWWLYHSTHHEGYLDRPLVIWLQGDPSASSSGYGNFGMLGPVDADGEPRNTTWVQSVNMMFVDCPVGTGFSYLHNNTAPHDTSVENAQDLVAMITVFLEDNPDFRRVPIYIAGQSYAAKTAVNAAFLIEEERRLNTLDCFLKGIILGNGLVSIPHATAAWPDLLLYMSRIDEQEHRTMSDDVIVYLKKSRHRDQRPKAFHWDKVMRAVERNQVSLYNVLQSAQDPTIYSQLDLTDLMNGPVRQHLGSIPDNVNWTGFYYPAYFPLFHEDFLNSEVQLVNRLLKDYGVEVIVYSGQLDFLTPAKGTMDWVDSLTWPGIHGYRRSTRQEFRSPVTDNKEMYKKSHGQFTFYWILNAGHLVPADAPDVALRMLNNMMSPSEQ